jgi:hypothetical protein
MCHREHLDQVDFTTMVLGYASARWICKFCGLTTKELLSLYEDPTFTNLIIAIHRAYEKKSDSELKVFSEELKQFEHICYLESKAV